MLRWRLHRTTGPTPRKLHDRRRHLGGALALHGDEPARTNAVKVRFFYPRTPGRQSRLNQRDLGVGACTFEYRFFDDLGARRQAQTLGRGAAIRPHQAARTELDAAEPADHQYGDPITLLPVYGLEDGAPGGAAGFAVVIEPIFLTDAISPAIMRGIGHLVLGKERERFRRRLHWRCKRQEAAFLDGFFVPRNVFERVFHRPAPTQASMPRDAR